MNPVRILLFTALAVPLLAVWTARQGDAAEDWAAHVAKACTSPRYGLRIAAARRVASGGDAAVPAVRAWEAKHGRNELPLAIVEAIADADPQVHGEAVLALLGDWAADGDFYWRASALRGLAVRGPATEPAVQRALGERFARHRDDRAWMARTHARFGSVLLGDEAAMALPESDPRARVRFASLLLARGVVPPLQPLIDALADERTFLGDPWGKRLGGEAHKALKAWLGADHPLAEGGSFEAKAAAIESLRAAAAAKSGQDLRLPEPATDPEGPIRGGIELLSCKHGDVFVRWTDDGLVLGGLDAATTVRIADAAWQELQQQRRALDLGSDLGAVVCDSLRVLWTEPDVHAKVAPGCLPAAATTWLERLAARVEEAGGHGLARDLRAGLGQFAAR